MQERIAVYAFSADPITFGHINLINRISKLYDHVHLVIAVNPNKSALLTKEEKMETVKFATAIFPNVSVHVLTGRYVVCLAQELGAQVIVRGLRNTKDFEDEEMLAEENRKIAPEVETLWLPCLPALTHVSSSVVKGHIGADKGWEKQVERLVPQHILKLLKKKYTLQKASKHWKSLMEDMGNPKGNEEIFKGLVTRYGESHRHYHVLAHIVSMLDEFEEVAHLATNSIAVRLAIWHHDAVYDVERSSVVASNEQRSAFLAEENLEHLAQGTGLVDCVAAHILATEHVGIGSHDPDTEILLDLDLAILGKSEEEFDEFDVNIRKEYVWVPQDIYKVERAKILKMFLGRESLYFTKILSLKYDKQARNNLKRAIARLES